MNLWLVIFFSGILTYLIRVSFILLIGDRDISTRTRLFLGFIPVSMLASIIATELLVDSSGINLTIDNYRLLAGIAAILVAWFTKNALITILVGMVLVWILPLIF
jgi:branched-subunit amino acid transport protein